MNDPLAQLRDIHLPPPVSWWPPAPGWWLLAALVVVAIGVLALYLRRRRRRRELYRVSLQELDAIRRAFASHADSQQLAAALSQLLRRVAITRWPDEEVAGLTGKDWLAWLDARSGGNDFSAGAGSFLEDGAYRPAGEIRDAEALLTVVENWLKKVTREAPRV
ncbi:DUF4381 domain-containing protein [Thiolapillus sp.]